MPISYTIGLLYHTMLQVLQKYIIYLTKKQGNCLIPRHTRGKKETKQVVHTCCIYTRHANTSHHPMGGIYSMQSMQKVGNWFGIPNDNKVAVKRRPGIWVARTAHSASHNRTLVTHTIPMLKNQIWFYVNAISASTL